MTSSGSKAMRSSQGLSVVAAVIGALTSVLTVVLTLTLSPRSTIDINNSGPSPSQSANTILACPGGIPVTLAAQVSGRSGILRMAVCEAAPAGQVYFLMAHVNERYFLVYELPAQ